MSRAAGQLERSLLAVTVGLRQQGDLRERNLADTRMGEYEQQVHLPITGTAQGYTYIDEDIAWEWPFLYAPAQRRVPFPTPHYGGCHVEMLSASDLVQITAQVLRWTITEEGWYVGATMRLASVAPLATLDPVPFSAICHLAFQGWACYAEGDEFTQ